MTEFLTKLTHWMIVLKIVVPKSKTRKAMFSEMTCRKSKCFNTFQRGETLKEYNEIFISFYRKNSFVVRDVVS